MKRTALRAMMLLVWMAGTITVAFAQAGLIVTTDPNQLSSTSSLSANRQIGPNLFVVDPSFTSIKLLPPGYFLGNSTQDIFVFCVDAAFHKVPNCVIQLTASRVLHSGGHQHGDPNGNDGPIGVGSLNPTSGTTGPLGLFFQSTFTASEASGTTNIDITGTQPNGFTGTARIVIMTQIHDQQVALPASGSGFTVDIASQGHGNDNVWVTPSTRDDFFTAIALFQLYVDELYDGQIEAANVPVTAANLPLGGIFDYKNRNWLPPHVSHRFGRDLDVGTLTPQGVPVIPINQRRSLAAAIVDAGFSMPVATESFDTCTNPPCDTKSHHWHLRNGY